VDAAVVCRPSPSNTRLSTEKLCSRSSWRSPNRGASSATISSLCWIRGKRSISASLSWVWFAVCETNDFGVNASVR
jgi:hypothetical protein